ncbi:trypsin-like peptidase domain-containing protein [Actinoplanes sp. NPDC024001]|uniref:VMAP-C domain-containing protein n=1 Tax=Actinoplanes sp. NPDC024001 TaxID=3154598 RepID=UPI0033D31792
MIDPQDNLVRLVRHCLVRVDATEGEPGSGFWVAPGIVLTCAHVAPRAQATITWQGRRFSGQVLQAAPDQRGPGILWPYPDIAVITVPDMIDNDCVWLSEQLIPINTPLLLIGHSEIYDNDLTPHSASGKFAGSYGDQGQLWRFTGDEIAPGMSGGPVLDLARGTVCGLIKTTRKRHTERGGLLVPISGLDQLDATVQSTLWQAHDQRHAHSPWGELRQRLAGSDDVTRSSTLLAQEEASLLGLLAQLNGTPDLRALYTEVVAPAAGLPPEPVTSIRRLAHLLADQLGSSGQLHPLLRLVHRLAQDERGTVGAALHEWTVRVAARRQEYEQLAAWRDAAGSGRHRAEDRPSIIVQVKPHSLDHRRYNATIWVHQDGKRSKKVFCDDSLGHDLHHTREIVAEQLRSLLKRLQGWAGVEFIVPGDLFDEDFENMLIGRYSRLGRTNPVVIRDLERLSDDETWRSWEDRWQALRAGDGSAEWLTCTHQASSDKFDATLRLNPEIALLGLTMRPGQYAEDALGVAIYAGVPAAVWSRDNCPEHQDAWPPHPCSGDRFRNSFARAIDGRRLAELPDIIQRVRNAAAAGEEPSWANIVLLWDDPEHRPEPNAPLVELA